MDAQVKALKDGDFKEFLRLVRESGNSSFKYLQNIYVNRDEQSQAMSIALAASETKLKDHGVCRVHGGGFAGTIQVFVENEYVEEYRAFIEKNLRQRFLSCAEGTQQGRHTGVIRVIGE